MRIVSAITVALLLLTPSTSATDTKGWRGIVPLRSTRADVEALLGEGTNECKCSYNREDANSHFVYSSGNCETGGSGDWNIAPETVIRFTIYPKPSLKSADLKIDESEFEKRVSIGDLLLYVNAEEGFSMEVQGGLVISLSYGPSAGDEYLRCPGYDGVHYSSSIPRELRPRLLERLNEYIRYSSGRQYERQYELFLPEFAAKMFTAKNKEEFGRLVRKSGGFEDIFVEFNPESITETEDKSFGKVYEVFGLAKTSDGGMVVESYRRTRVALKNGDWFFVDLFRGIPA